MTDPKQDWADEESKRRFAKILEAQMHEDTIDFLDAVEAELAQALRDEREAWLRHAEASAERLCRDRDFGNDPFGFYADGIDDLVDAIRTRTDQEQT